MSLQEVREPSFFLMQMKSRLMAQLFFGENVFLHFIIMSVDNAQVDTVNASLSLCSCATIHTAVFVLYFVDSYVIK